MWLSDRIDWRDSIMDKKYIDSLVKCILRSDASDYNIKYIAQDLIEIDDEGKPTTTKEIYVSTVNHKTPISESWVAINLIIFALYDGYLEDKYNLNEGDSFRAHYEGLPTNDMLEIIYKYCYRIIKLIRNAVQHNLSNIVIQQNIYKIKYQYGQTIFGMEITFEGLNYLYTLILNIVQNRIMGLPNFYLNQGFKEGIFYTQYIKMTKEISNFSDDISTNLIPVHASLQLRDIYRSFVRNPIILEENSDEIIFKHHEKNMTVDENNVSYQYSTDYVYKEYLLPQELGELIKPEETDIQKIYSNIKIKFNKKDLLDKWKIQN